MTSSVRILQILNNNAVLVNDQGQEQVLVGRGIGFKRRPGDELLPNAGDVQASYLEMSPARAPFLKSISSMDPLVVETITQAVELAVDILGELHPSVYLLLAEHLSVAIHRVARGEHIQHSLSEEIRTLFPRETAAADLIVRFINSNLPNIDLPMDEAAYVALHLNAARSGGVPVKEPLATAHAVARAANLIRHHLDPDDQLPDAGLMAGLTHLVNRLEHGQPRVNHLVHAVRRDIGAEFELAEKVIRGIIGDLDKQRLRTQEGWSRAAKSTPRPRSPDEKTLGKWISESAYLAVFLHSWRNNNEFQS